ncbi:5-oxoprolinase subunit PxpB [Pseudoalteromonas sp. YIC-827]|uniref:5-oxoprolinase subunit PxpB n=1 Tax=Pseudoalteromonas qingdaonensis TaxID=3131913 RepID=A0ABU9MX09_9GAMM
MTSALPAPHFYQIDNATLVLDASAISALDKAQKQRMINALARQLLLQPDYVDVVSADQTLTLYGRSHLELERVQHHLLLMWQQFDEDSSQSQFHEIKVQYGGKYGLDLASVAKSCGLSEREVINIHTSGLYTVDFIGFQPGFAYISGLDSRLQLPRLATPRTLVPKGSVAIAADKTAVYPANSPGGWHIIGHTEQTLFDPSKQPPALFAPGDTLRFVEA